jgi:hypothetical protein
MDLSGKRLALVLLPLLCGAALAATAVADEPAGNEYDNGARAYFSGAYQEAIDFLSQAVKSGSKDPRVYYYRGLAYLKLNRPNDAKSDFAAGATIEMLDSDGFYNISKALERVQGQARLTIEGHRAAAREEAERRARELQQRRYELIKSSEPKVVEPPPAASTPAVAPPDGAAGAAASAAPPGSRSAPEPQPGAGAFAEDARPPQGAFSKPAPRSPVFIEVAQVEPKRPPARTTTVVEDAANAFAPPGKAGPAANDTAGSEVVGNPQGPSSTLALGKAIGKAFWNLFDSMTPKVEVPPGLPPIPGLTPGQP